MRYKWDLHSCFEELADLDLVSCYGSPFSSRRRLNAKRSEAFPIRLCFLAFRLEAMTDAAAVASRVWLRCRRRFVCEAVGECPSLPSIGTGAGSRDIPPSYTYGEKLGEIEVYVPWWLRVFDWEGGSIFALESVLHAYPVVVFPSLFDSKGGWSPCALRC